MRKLEFCSISGSQRSYLNEHVRKKLNLKTICKERLFMKSFGNDSSLFQELDVVKMNLKTLNKTFHLEVLVWPLICTPIANQQNLTVSKSYSHLRHLELAHPFDEKHISIKMLIGIDYYHSFFQEKIIRDNENEPVTKNPYLGWIVSGSFKHVRFPSAYETHVFFVKNEPFNEVSNNVLNDYFSQVFPNNSFEPASYENVYSNFLKELKFLDSRYSVKVLFKIGTGVFPDNYSLESFVCVI